MKLKSGDLNRQPTTEDFAHLFETTIVQSSDCRLHPEYTLLDFAADLHNDAVDELLHEAGVSVIRCDFFEDSRVQNMTANRHGAVLCFNIRIAICNRDSSRVQLLLNHARDFVRHTGSVFSRQTILGLLQSGGMTVPGSQNVLQLAAEIDDTGVNMAFEEAGIDLAPFAPAMVAALSGQSAGPVSYLKHTYAELKKATNGFANMIGEGAFAKVYRGECVAGHAIVAVKVFREDIYDLDNVFRAECESLAKCQHENIVRLLSVCVGGEGGPRFRSMLLEFFPGGSLRRALERRDWSFGLDKRLSVLCGVCRALVYLHEKLQKIHGDVKPSNILLDGDAKGVLGDLGSVRVSRPAGATAITATALGTYGFVSPEAAMFGKVTSAMDVFAFGVTLLEALAGQKGEGVGEDNVLLTSLDGFRNVSGVDLLSTIVDRHLKTLSSDMLTADRANILFDVAFRCADFDGARRPSMSEVLAKLSCVLMELSGPVVRMNQVQKALDVAACVARKYADGVFEQEHRRILSKLATAGCGIADNAQSTYTPPCCWSQGKPRHQLEECENCHQAKRGFNAELDAFAAEFVLCLHEDATKVPWGNSNSSKWATAGCHAEFAKLFCSWGYAAKEIFDELDAAALINMISWSALFPEALAGRSGSSQAAAEVRNVIHHTVTGLTVDAHKEMMSKLKRFLEDIESFGDGHAQQSATQALLRLRELEP